MKGKVISAFCLFVAMVLSPAVAKSQGLRIDKTFLDLHSLIGTWRMATEKGVLYESWEKMNDSTLVGKGYKLNGNDTVIMEAFQLLLRNKKVMFVPTVAENNNQPVSFSLVDKTDDRYTFENKAHDFPQRIIYNLPRKNMLHAWIEGDLNGRLTRLDYKYVKVL